MDWMEILDAALTGILIPLFTLLCVWVRMWVKERIAYMKSKKEMEYFDYHLDKVDELIYTVVMEVEGVYVGLLEKNGLFDKEAQVEAFNMAKGKVLSQLTIQAKDVLEKTYADYVSYIESKIEEIVEKM